MAASTTEVIGDNILREVRPEDSKITPLDSTFLDLSDEEKSFLKASISVEGDALKEIILKTQKEYELMISPSCSKPDLSQSIVSHQIPMHILCVPTLNQRALPIPMHPAFPLRLPDDDEKSDLSKGIGSGEK